MMLNLVRQIKIHILNITYINRHAGNKIHMDYKANPSEIPSEIPCIITTTITMHMVMMYVILQS